MHPLTDTDRRTAGVEAGLALKFAAVGLIGFVIDAALLRLGMGLGLHAAVARAVSLFVAMQATFAINGLQVFHCLTRKRLLAQWAGYMATNGFGNLCNYWIFVTLISLHHSPFSNPYFAIVAGSLAAYLINYAGTRLLVFGKGRASVIVAKRRRARDQVCGPAAGEDFAKLAPEA
ncbi:MAG TPA: GtrA family protein [Caulobacteraceae bacterium]